MFQAAHGSKSEPQDRWLLLQADLARALEEETHVLQQWLVELDNQVLSCTLCFGVRAVAQSAVHRHHLTHGELPCDVMLGS
jgi:hypothetical protein